MNPGVFQLVQLTDSHKYPGFTRKERLGSLIITGQLLSSDPSPPALSSQEGTVDSGLLHVFYRRGQYRYLNTICSLQITFLSLSNTVIWHGTVQIKKIPWINGFFLAKKPHLFPK